MNERAWFWGGGLMLASSPLSAVSYPSMGIPAVIAVSLGMVVLIFAPELSGRRTVRILLVAAAAWGLAEQFFPFQDPILFQVSSIVAAAFTGLIAVDFGRNEALPARWRWAPAWTLLALVILAVATQIMPAVTQTLAPEPWILFTLANVAFGAAPAFLGTCAVMFGVRQRTRRREPQRELIAAE